jgi:hypothetical protein
MPLELLLFKTKKGDIRSIVFPFQNHSLLVLLCNVKHERRNRINNLGFTKKSTQRIRDKKLNQKSTHSINNEQKDFAMLQLIERSSNHLLTRHQPTHENKHEFKKL